MPDEAATVHDLDAIRAAAKAAGKAAMSPDPVDAIIDEFNKLYMLVNEGGRAVIFQPGFDPILKRRRFDRLTTKDLQTLYLNRLIKVGEDEKNRPIWKTAADVWLRHKDRRQYIHGVAFDPTSTHARFGVLNLWEGYAVKPKPGNWSLLRDHIFNVICAGDPVRNDYLTGWMARMFQQPAEQGEVAVVMKGAEGTGKGTVAKALKRIVGHHSLAVANAKHLVGNFNAHLRDCIFLFADEAFFAGDRAHIGVLKSLVTEPTLTVEAKFANSVETPNMLHIMMASNEDWVVPASIESRRFFVLDVDDDVKGNHAYFADIWKQMDAGGYEAMLHDLLHLDLAGFNVRSVPTTEGLQRQRKLSLPTTEAWWLDCLERGYVFRSRLGLESEFGTWHSKISMELLFASYLEFAKCHHERRVLSRESLGRFLVTLDAVGQRWRNAVVGEAITDVEDPYGGSTRKATLVRAPDRATGYHLGNLDQARKSFTEKTGLRVDWDGGEIDDDDVA